MHQNLYSEQFQSIYFTWGKFPQETQPALLKSNPNSGMTTYIDEWQYSRLYEYKTEIFDPVGGGEEQA